ncbi:MAG: hypothetical protein Q4G60_14965, partial [bacterium]|nr:hypothetical protein [bacterium]
IEEEPIIEEEPVIDGELPELPDDGVPPAESGEILQDEDISKLLASLGELDTEPSSDEGTSITEDQQSDAPVSQPAEGQELVIDPEELANMADLLNIKDLSSEGEDNQSDGLLPLNDSSDVTELLDQISDDSELSEINDLLKKNDNNETIEDDDILAMLEKPSGEDGANADAEDVFAIEEPLSDDDMESGEEDDDTGKKKHKKKEKKAKKDKSEKKPGFFARLFNSLTEEEMTEASAEEVKDLFGEASAAESLENADAANQELLDEMEAEDSGKKGKKGKKEKKPKEKKDKKTKEKKPKVIKEPKPEKTPGKKLPKKQVIVISIMCASIGILMTAIAFYYPYYKDMRQAALDYQNQNYEAAYESLTGHYLNDEEKDLYQKTTLMLRLDRKYQSYMNYTKLGMELEAFNALLQGMEAADQYLEQAELLGIMQEYRTLAQQIEDMLSNQYGVSPDKAREWLAIEDPQVYSRTISDFLLGTDTMNLQTSDGQPYTAESTADHQQAEEQPDNPIIAGEESEFEDGKSTQNVEELFQNSEAVIQ